MICRQPAWQTFLLPCLHRIAPRSIISFWGRRRLAYYYSPRRAVESIDSRGANRVARLSSSSRPAASDIDARVENDPRTSEGGSGPHPCSSREPLRAARRPRLARARASPAPIVVTRASGVCVLPLPRERVRFAGEEREAKNEAQQADERIRAAKDGGCVRARARLLPLARVFRLAPPRRSPRRSSVGIVATRLASISASSPLRRWRACRRNIIISHRAASAACDICGWLSSSSAAAAANGMAARDAM